MSKLLSIMVMGTLLSAASWAHAYDFSPVSEAEQACYAKAMVGMDSVINARLGVPPEHALELAALNLPVDNSPQRYSKDMLKTILNAYLWQQSPHSYAVKVFYRCAVEQGPLHSAQNDWWVSE